MLCKSILFKIGVGILNGEIEKEMEGTQREWKGIQKGNEQELEESN